MDGLPRNYPKTVFYQTQANDRSLSILDKNPGEISTTDGVTGYQYQYDLAGRVIQLDNPGGEVLEGFYKLSHLHCRRSGP